MNRIYLKEIAVKNNISNKEFNVNNITLRNRFKTIEDKLIIFFYYNKDTLELKKEIKIIPIDKTSNYKINEECEIYLASDNQLINTNPGTTKLGKGIIKSITNDYLILDNLKVYIDNNYITSYINLFDSSSINTCKNINKYISTLFKVYYYSIIYLLEMYDYSYGGSKLSALASYLAIINILKGNFSYPNVFIRNNKTEFDLLLLKDNVENNKYYYEINEVKAIIEIKSCGYIESSEWDFKRYIESNFNVKDTINDKFKNQVKNLSNSNIKYIYFSLYERNYNKYYEIINKLNDRYIGIFCSIIDNKYIVPNNYDIPEIFK